MVNNKAKAKTSTPKKEGRTDGWTEGGTTKGRRGGVTTGRHGAIYGEILNKLARRHSSGYGGRDRKDGARRRDGRDGGSDHAWENEEGRSNMPEGGNGGGDEGTASSRGPFE